MTVNEKNRYAPIKLPFVPFELVLCKKTRLLEHVVTDFSSLSSSYMSIDVVLKAGNDIWLSTSTTFVDKLNAYKNDPAMATYLREAVHRLLYTTANSAAMNPYIVESGITPKTIEITPWWETALIIIDVVFGLLAAGSVVMLVLTVRKNKNVG